MLENCLTSAVVGTGWIILMSKEENDFLLAASQILLNVIWLLLFQVPQVPMLEPFLLEQEQHTQHTTVLRLCGICPGQPG